MKKYIVAAFLCLLLCAQATAQENRGLSLNAIVEYGSLSYSVRGLGGESDAFTAIGLQVAHSLTTSWDLVYGLSYAWGRDNSNRRQWRIPTLARFHFLNYFFVEGGLYFVQTDQGNLRDKFLFGPGFGVGAAYTFSSGWKVSLRPSAYWAGLFAKEYSLSQGGVELGIGYKF
ncbi:MAG: porin family protein [Prevotellaceae bacterium]|jgi:hypothetical protein|nr:porin family protein [Prevotellaceae bacterium]